MEHFTNQQVSDIKAAVKFNAEGGVSQGLGITNSIVGGSKKQDHKGRWNRQARRNAKTGLNYPAVKRNGYSGFIVFHNGAWGDLDDSNAHIAGLWAMPKVVDTEDVVTTSGGNINCIKDVIKVLASDEQYETYVELTQIIESAKFDKFATKKVQDMTKLAVAASNSESQTVATEAVAEGVLPKAVLSTFKVADLRTYIGKMFPSIPASALTTMTKPQCLACIS